MPTLLPVVWKRRMKKLIALVLLFVCYSTVIYSQQSSGVVLLLVDSTLVEQLGDSYQTYKRDLIKEGYIVSEELVNPSTPAPQIKTIIQEYSTSLSSASLKFEGVILIGNLKAAYSIVRNGDYSNPSSVELWLSLDATDMYYGDLDGDWDCITPDEFNDIVDNAPSYVAQLHKEQSCSDFINEYIVDLEKEKIWNYQSISDKSQYSIEIWVARIMGHNLSISGKTEIDILNDYFSWNHILRTGGYKISDTCYMLNATGSGCNDQSMDYSWIFEEVITAGDVTKQTYLPYLQEESGSRLFYATIHSCPGWHQFSDGALLTTNELLKIKKTGVFYLLNCCSGCRWDEFVAFPASPNYLGGVYVFDKSDDGGGFGVGAIGFTGVGGFNNLNYFTERYNDFPFANYGDMYVYWFNKNLQINFSTHNYVFLGDPTIGPDMAFEGTSVSDSPALIKEFRLSQNYPNPFNPTTTISFSIPGNMFVTLKVYDALGREIETLVSGHCQAGENRAEWGTSGLPCGLYFYRLEAGKFLATRKMILIR